MSAKSSTVDVVKDPRQLTEPPAEPTTKALFLRLIGFMLAGRKGRFTLMVTLVLVSVALGAVFPILMGLAVNILGGKGNFADLIQVVIALLVVALLMWLLGLWRERTVARLAQDTLVELRTTLFDHIQTLSLNFYDRQPIGELMSRMTNDVETIDQFLSYGFSQAITAVSTIVLTIVLMFIINLPLTITTLVMLPIMFGLVALIGRVAGPAFSHLQEQMGELNGFMEETIAGEKTIIAYRQQATAGDILEEQAQAVLQTGQWAQFIALTLSPAMNIFQNVQTAMIALVGSILAIYGMIGFGIVVTFMTYSMQLQSPIQQLGQIYNTFLLAMAGARRVFAMLDEVPMVQDQPGAQALQQVEGHVVFNSVDFSYVKGRKILRDNSFEALPGQMIGLCGPTGAGKSTIMNILTRYYDIDSGSVTIDGRDIKDFTQESLRQQIGAVLQEAFLFSDTIMNNLKYARQGATDEECIAAAKDANAHEFIMQLPDGYNTLLTERGANLSQGQRQMLTIARAMVAQPRMLILDEATSNVDTRTEKLIQQGLVRLMEGKTSFVIAHRLSTIRNAKQILVINNGEIIERGTHDELMAMSGFYYDLFMSQFKGKFEGLNSSNM